MHLGAGAQPVFPPVVKAHLIKVACEMPDDADRSLSIWTCADLARELKRDGIVDDISPKSVQRFLSSNRLKPWKVHHWLSSKGQRDEGFRAATLEICDLYTRPLEPHERILCLDEKTSLQPRTRSAATRPAQPGLVPVRLEHEYERKGALHLFAALDIRTGEVLGLCRQNKSQAEFIELLEEIDRRTPASITQIHLICDNLSVHHGKQVRAWLEEHPRFRMHFTPVHCSWMNQIEQWFSLFQRKRLKAPNFASLADLEERIHAFINEWNERAHPFEWTSASFEKVLTKVEVRLAAAA